MAAEDQYSKVMIMIIRLRENLRKFGSIYAPPETSCDTADDRRLCNHLSEKSGWSKKTARQHAREQNADLRGYYLHNIPEFQSYHLVYVDESGCGRRIVQTGWAPLGKTPLQVTQFHRDLRYIHIGHKSARKEKGLR
ncbi:hypothetical protein N7475_003657 [Penicillium sp. IBT 31633x]|nr:hypothetical protein N7475_003657 [Penicillium sp. IBT 31633x]